MPGQTEEQSDPGLHCLPFCLSVCIIWTHYSMAEPHSSNFDYNKCFGCPNI